MSNRSKDRPEDRVEKIVDALAVLLALGGESPVGVQLPDDEAVLHFARLVGQGEVERVAQRVRRVGGKQENAPARFERDGHVVEFVHRADHHVRVE